MTETAPAAATRLSLESHYLLVASMRPSPSVSLVPMIVDHRRGASGVR